MLFSKANTSKQTTLYAQAAGHIHPVLKSAPGGTDWDCYYLCASSKETEAQSLKAPQLQRLSWPALFEETLVNGTLSPTLILVPLMCHG